MYMYNLMRCFEWKCKRISDETADIFGRQSVLFCPYERRLKSIATVKFNVSRVGAFEI